MQAIETDFQTRYRHLRKLFNAIDGDGTPEHPCSLESFKDGEGGETVATVKCEGSIFELRIKADGG